jgi:thiol:disulfide interchange protein
MRHHTIPALILSVVGVAAALSVSGAEQPAQKSARPNLYDTRADGKEQITAALKTAKAEDKRVLLKFGANW